MTEYLIASAIVFLGAFLQSSFGYGLGVFAAPLLLVLNPAWVPEPLLTASILMTLLISLRELQDLSWKDLAASLPGYLIGAFGASFAIAVLPQREIAVASGLLILGGAALSMVGIKLAPNPPVLFGAGFLSGLMSTVASVGGAPMALVYQSEEGSRVRSTLNGFFTIGTLLSLASLAVVGNYHQSDFIKSAILLPGVLAGFFLSKRYLPNIDQRTLRKGLIYISLAASLVIIIRAVTAP